MDVLLTHGYCLASDPAERRVMKPYPPLGILYISAFLKREGFDVSVFDTTFRSEEELSGLLLAERPRIVGVYVNLMTKQAALRIIAAAAAAGSTVVVGGPDVPEYAREYLTAGARIAVMGEGEEVMKEIASGGCTDADLSKIDGIAFLSHRAGRGDGAVADGQFIRTRPRALIPDLDALPLPDRGAIDIGAYLSAWRGRHGVGSLSLVCARGCPFHCTWCSRTIYGESHRRRSVNSVVDEIEYLLSTYRPDMLWFADDVFTIHHKWFHAFHAEMKRRGLKVPFECISRADMLTDEIIGKMAELGAVRIWYGSESGSQDILDAMRRGVTVEKIASATASARRHGIQSGLFVMLGYPGESIEDIAKTADHLVATGPDAFLTTVAYPIKGTGFYESVSASITPPDRWDSVTDRDLRYSGRRSDAFYWFAVRYLTNDVAARMNGSTNGRSALSRAAARAKAAICRRGMVMAG